MYNMSYLGDGMASRMEKYYNQRSRIASRSYRNQSLYQELDDLKSDDELSTSSSNIMDEFKSNQVNKSNNFYNDYKFNQVVDGDLGNRLLERQKSRYYDLNGVYSRDLYDMQIRQENHKEISAEDTRRIEELIDAITSTSRLSKINTKELNKLKNFDTSNYNNIEIISHSPNNFANQKIEEKDLKEFNEFFQSFNDDEKRKFNLKLKVLVGLVIIIITGLIIFLIYKDIK